MRGKHRGRPSPISKTRKAVGKRTVHEVRYGREGRPKNAKEMEGTKKKCFDTNCHRKQQIGAGIVCIECDGDMHNSCGLEEKIEEDGKTIGKVCIDCWLQKRTFDLFQEDTECEVQRDGKVNQTQEVNEKYKGSPTMSTLEVYEAENALIHATLRGPLMALADKLKGDPGYWAVPVFNYFSESWACTKCEDEDKGTLRACGKQKKTKSSGILLPRARCEKCTRSTEGMPLVEVMVDQMIFEANENPKKQALAL